MADGVTEARLENIQKLTVAELHIELKKLNLSQTGKKAVLVSRLFEATSRNPDTLSERNGGNNEEVDSDGSTKTEASTSTYASALPEKNRKEEQGGGHGGWHGGPKFSFKDIEECIEPYSGDDNREVYQWLDEFESTCDLLDLGELHRVIFARRLLKGSAKLFINAEGVVRNWATFRQLLICEFGETVNSSVVHKKLQNRVKQSGETYQQYLYAMVAIGRQANVEEEALIAYAIDGIRDHESNKAILYTAKSMMEFKQQLKIYERMKQRETARTKVTQPAHAAGTSAQTNASAKITAASTSASDSNASRKKCFGCGKFGHGRRECPDVKCYNCNESGHKSPNCPQPKVKGATTATTANVSALYSSKLYKSVEISGQKLMAMCDTGSDVTCVSEKCYKSLGKMNDLPSCARVVTGIGKANVSVIGVFRTDILIDGASYSDNVLVLPNCAMDCPMIIGLTIMAQAMVSIDTANNSIIFTKRVDSDECVNKISDNEAAVTAPTIVSESNDVDEVVDPIMLVDVSENDFVDIPNAFRSDVMDLVGKYEPAVNVNTPIKTKIVMVNESPIYQRPRRLAPREKEVVSAQVDEWLRDGVIRESFSEFASPVVVVQKKSGAYRVCVDYRRLNKNIIKDHFPMPIVEEQIDKLSVARVFTVLDLKNGFFHVPVDDASVKYTAFVTSDGQYEFLKTPFGLSVSPTSFLRYVQHVFKELVQKKVVITYMDDVIIPSVDEATGLQMLREVLQVAEKAGLVINWAKCRFLVRKVEFLGYELTAGMISPSPNTVAGVRKFPEPSTADEVRRFLGMCGYFRKFVDGFSMIAKPLTDLTKKSVVFRFGDGERFAFQQLKNALCSEPVLKIFDSKADTELHTDASQEGYGAVLMQKCQQDEQYHPVYYLSKQTTDAEKRYHSYELEMLAIVYAFQKLHSYLFGLRVTVVTDCSAIKSTMDKRDIVPRIARWVMRLQHYDYVVQHRAGVKMRHVDALSRSILQIDNNFLSLIRERQKHDDRLAAIVKIVEKTPYDNYTIQGGVLMKCVNGKPVMVVPSDLQLNLLRQVHDNGHFGAQKMCEIVEKDYYMPKVREQSDKVVSSCVQCILAERKRGKREGLLRPIPKEDAPLLTYHIDYLGPMEMTAKKYKHIFVVIDGFTKFTWLYPTKSASAQEALTCLERQQQIFGNPRRIISDRGSVFTADVFRDYCESENIEHHQIATGVPRGNGQVERVNQVIIPMLTKLSEDRPDRWYQHVHRVQRCLNSHHQRSIGYSPFEVLIGVDMRQKEDAKIMEMIEESIVDTFMDARDELRQNAKGNIGRCQEQQRRNYDQKCKVARQYKTNDLVAIERTQFGTGLKLKGKFLGPYVVVNKTGPDRYQVRKVGDREGPGKTMTSADHMKPWIIEKSSEGDE